MENGKLELEIQRLVNWLHSGNEEEIKKCLEDLKRMTGKGELEILELCIEKGE